MDKEECGGAVALAHVWEKRWRDSDRNWRAHAAPWQCGGLSRTD